MLRFQFRSRALDARSRIIHQNIQLAELLLDLLKQLANLLVVTQMSAVSEASDSQRDNLVVSLGSGLVIAKVVECDVDAP